MLEGRAVFQVTETAEIMVQTLLLYRERGAYLLHEFVVMPDHLHVLLTPSPTISLEKAVQLIKGGSSHRIHQARNQKMEIWQVGFHDWTIRDDNDWRTKVEYIHTNPVRAKLVEKSDHWPYSSASGKFILDPPPAKFKKLSSGAKAQAVTALTPGLKPRPPKEKDNVGPEGPTPNSPANPNSIETPKTVASPNTPATSNAISARAAKG